MTAQAWKIYDNVKEYIGDGTIDMDAGDAFFAMVLATSAYTYAITHDTYSQITEVANANGYTTGGKPLVTTTWTQPSAGISMFDFDALVWTASGGSITARRALLVHVAAGSGLPQTTDKLIASSLLDDTDADVIASDTGTLTVTPHANGAFRISGGT